MKFGKEFKTHLEETLPEWRDKFLSYKTLKKLLNNLPSGDNAAGDQPPPPPPDWFVDILTQELEKFNDFYVDKEEEFIIRLQELAGIAELVGKETWFIQPKIPAIFQKNPKSTSFMTNKNVQRLLRKKELKGRIEQLREQKTTNGVFTSKTEFSEEMMDIRKDFVSIHGEMVLLKNYSSLNFAGLIKILKKYDKRTGGLLQLPFTQLVLDQPFFTTEPLTRLVHECEANLELLFPLEEEVVQCANDKDRSGDTSSSHREDTTDVYRSTLAAMKTIQGLRKASSTHNPLSFASIFGKQDSESTGAVTSENSPNDTLQNGQEANIDTTHSPD